MTGTIDSFTLISLIVLLVLVFKLRSVLGRKTEDDESRIKARTEERDRAAAQSSDKVVTLPRRSREEVPSEQVAAVPSPVVASEERIRTLSANDPSVQSGLLDILKSDPEFDPDHFMKGARQAYEMIVTAFAEGNRKVLRNLLEPDVFDGFAQAILERERRGEKIEQRFVGINKADILEAEVDRGVAQITVRFVSQLIKSVTDKAGTIIDGDPGRVKDLTDIFTFARDISSAEARRNPNWRLVATASPN